MAKCKRVGDGPRGNRSSGPPRMPPPSAAGPQLSPAPPGENTYVAGLFFAEVANGYLEELCKPAGKASECFV
jgi:hypothetical protein